MTRRTQLTSLLGLGSVLLLSSAVLAQPGAGPAGMRPGGGPPAGAPGAPGAPAGAPGAPAAAGETGVVSNETTTTTTTTTDVDAAGLPIEDPTLPNTGGAPWLMALAGTATAAGGLLLRRKLG